MARLDASFSYVLQCLQLMELTHLKYVSHKHNTLE
jgi:hypothetical protein